jgi:hypothetical protein
MQQQQSFRFFVVTYESNIDSDYEIFTDQDDAETLFAEWSQSDWFAELLEDDQSAVVNLIETTYDTQEPWADNDEWCWWDEPGDFCSLEVYPESAA